MGENSLDLEFQVKIPKFKDYKKNLSLKVSIYNFQYLSVCIVLN